MPTDRPCDQSADGPEHGLSTAAARQDYTPSPVSSDDGVSPVRSPAPVHPQETHPTSLSDALHLTSVGDRLLRDSGVTLQPPGDCALPQTYNPNSGRLRHR